MSSRSLHIPTNGSSAIDAFLVGRFVPFFFEARGLFSGSPFANTLIRFSTCRRAAGGNESYFFNNCWWVIAHLPGLLLQRYFPDRTPTTPVQRPLLRQVFGKSESEVWPICSMTCRRPRRKGVTPISTVTSASRSPLRQSTTAQGRVRRCPNHPPATRAGHARCGAHRDSRCALIRPAA